MIQRREFLIASLMASVGGLAHAKASGKQEPRNPHPYQDVDWNTAHQIVTSSHLHNYFSQNPRWKQTAELNYGFFTWSNYYPSMPCCPMKEYRRYQNILGAKHPVLVKGQFQQGPFDWNAIIEQWKDQLPEKEQKRLPFKLGAYAFPDVPADVLEAPNAEHHSFKDTQLHACAVGSWYASGTFDAHNRYKTHSSGYHFGVGESWKDAFPKMLAQLEYPDGGGITINHPVWSRLKDEQVLSYLDFDPRVLGIEVYNRTCYHLNKTEWSEELWDRILRTGRQCFGFSVPDHHPEQAVNILLTPVKSVHACLKAYRQGNFYFAMNGRDLRFRRLSLTGDLLEAATDKPSTIQVVSADGVIGQKLNTTAFSMKITGAKTYVRVKALTDNEILFSQPFLLG